MTQSGLPEPRGLISLKAQLQEQRMPIYKKLVRWTWGLLYATIFGIASLFIVINFTGIPSFRELEDPKSKLASEVLANNNEVLGRFFIQNRVPATFNELSPWLEKALVSTEDERFYTHCGIDARAIGRVLVRTVLLQDQSAGGGSTITQQLAKMLYSDREFEGMGTFEKAFALLYRKLREWITAVKLEKGYTKQEIIAMYLNQANFVNNAYGIRAAAEIYFGVAPSKLKKEDAAMLVGMLQNPSRYNPIARPERCIKRRMIVLSQMRYAGHISQEEYDKLKLKPLDMSKFKRLSYSEDKAPYLCAELKKDVKAILNLPECLKSDGTSYNIFKDGLKIYTTIDPVYQQHAEAAMQAHMKKIQTRLFSVWKGRDPWTYKGADTKDDEIKQRQESLQSLIFTGERYRGLRNNALQKIIDDIQTAYNFEPSDDDIVNMLEEEKKSGSISKKLAKKLVTIDQATGCRKIMDSKYWPELKKQWTSLQSTVKKVYATKVPMRVFSWSASKLEKDTFMSPMDSLKYHRMFLQSGILAIDPTTSEVKAWVGGINFKHFQFDHIRTPRQVGSTFKPFIYGTAIAQQNLTPCFQVYDMPVEIPAYYQNFKHGQSWTPKNSTGTYSYKLVTLKEALKNSINSVSAYLMKQMGSTEPVFDMLNNMGIDPAGLPNSPTICLGSADLTVWQMAGAYTAFANNGVYNRPSVIREIKDKNGKVIYRSTPEEHQALPQTANYMLNQMLQYNIKGAPGINQLKSQVGGKTGTTNDYSDGWFMGITPRLVVGTWVGGEDRWIRFNSLEDGQGARMARPIFADFVKRLEQDKTSGFDINAKFKLPAGALPDMNCNPIQDSASPSGGTFDEEGLGGADSGWGDGQTPTPPTPQNGGGTGTKPPPATVPGTKPPVTPKKPAPKPDSGFN
jgi:penicillin-binding protein 1A